MRGDFKEVTYGYCKCGCGEQTKIATQTDKRCGHIKGEPIRFLFGHHLGFGKSHPKWNGGKAIVNDENTSYVKIKIPNHARSHWDGYVLEHIIVVEKALGFSIGKEAVVHHIDGDGLNNKLSNLMVFKNNAEHTKYHARIRKGAKAK